MPKLASKYCDYSDNSKFSHNKNADQENNNKASSLLYIVATPIGNLQDISARALHILQNEVDLILAEDTRHSRQLLQHYGIKATLLSLHEHNEKHKSQELIKMLQHGKSMALISDAGTPLISDPGYTLVKLAHQNNIKVVPIPGPCAGIVALSASGLATDAFVFAGFLANKKADAVKQLNILVEDYRTIILYLSPHRIISSLELIIEIFGKLRQAVIAKELTKMFETIYSASLEEILSWLLEDDVHQKGEFVLLIAGKTIVDNTQNSNEIDEKTLQILHILAKELPPKQASKLTAEITGFDKKQLYNVIVNKVTTK